MPLVICLWLRRSFLATSGVNVTLQPAAEPTVAVTASLTVTVSTAAQATAAALDVSSLVGVGAPAEALTGIDGAVVASPKTSVVVVLPPPGHPKPPEVFARPPPFRPPPVQPAPPPPIAAAAAITVEVPFSPAATINERVVARALAAIASTAVPESPGYTPASTRVADIVVASQLALSSSSFSVGGGGSGGAQPTAAEIAAAVAAAVAETLVLDRSQIEVTVGRAAAAVGGNRTAAIGVTVSRIGNDAAAAAAVARGIPGMADIIALALSRVGVAGAQVASTGAGSTATLVMRVAVGVLQTAASQEASAALSNAFALAALRQQLAAASIPGASSAVVSAVAVTPSPSPPPPAPPPPAPAPPPDPDAGLTAADRLAVVVSIADNLANSLMDGLKPGETATFSSPMLQIAARVEIAPSATLTTQGFTAPGSPAAFNALPAAALAAAAPGSLIRAHLIAAAFDFHANEVSADVETAATAGVARFVLAGGDKAPFMVSGLATPVTFSLAAPPPGTRDLAVCAFW